MAFVLNPNNSNRMIQLTDMHGNWRTIRLPGLTVQQFEAVRNHTALYASRIANTPINESKARWPAGVDDGF